MRSTHRICSALILTLMLASMALQASAATVFRDNFSDGDAQDGTPVTWTERPNQNGYDATSGDYVLTPFRTAPMFSAVVDIPLRNISIRTQVRTSAENGDAIVTARLQDSLALPSTGAYFGGIGYWPDRGGTRLELGRADGGGNTTLFGGEPVLPFDVRTEDAVLQLDVIGNKLKLWAWKAGDPMPDQPQLTATDNTYSEGTMRIYNNARNNNIATFRYVHVADMHIPVPEPATLLLAMLGMAGPYCFGRRR